MFGSDTKETGNVPLEVAYPLTFYRDTIDPAEAAMITIARGEKAIANIHMHPVAALHLRMSAGNPDDGQQNPNGTYVMLQERLFDGTPISVPAVSRMVAPGVIEVAGMAPGHYNMQINSPGKDRTQVTSFREVDLTSSGDFDKNQGQQPVPVTARIQFHPPSAGAMIVLGPGDPVHNQILFRRDQSDSDGTFTLTAVPGKYTLLALENGWELEWSNPAMLKPYMALGESVVVEPRGKYEVKIGVQ